MELGLLKFAPEVKPLQAISPTRFNGVIECALREVWKANGVPPLLPSSPAAHLGSVIHRLLQEAGEGHFVSGGTARVEQRWRDLVSAAEHEMQESWLERHLIPLEQSIPDFEVRRIQARDRALEITEVASASPKAPLRSSRLGADYGFELPVSSPDNLVRARIDAVIQSAEGPIVRDYKSGAIFVDHPGISTGVSAGYETQLRIYAALYAYTRGRWPVRLEVVALSGAVHAVNFSETACTSLVEEARRTLSRVNQTITECSQMPDELQRQLASPRPETCKRCPFRPGCAPYRAAVVNRQPPVNWPRDLWGQVMEIRQLGNSKMMIKLNTRDGTSRIRGLTSGEARHPALVNLRPGDETAAFNLGSTGSDQAFLESQFTTIYRVASDASG